MDISKRRTSNPQSKEQMLSSLICSKVELKILVRYYLMPAKMTTVQKIKEN